MLHHSTISRREEQSSLLTSATRDEIHVAQILLHIATSIRTLEYGSGGLRWGRKKRRSRSDEAASPYHTTDVEQEKMPPPPPPPKAEMMDAAAAAAASPVTPLCFAPSESDDHTKKTSKNKLRKEYIEMIEELSELRDLLRGKIENVTNYHNKLTAYNTQLKAMKQEALNSCPRKEETKSESGMDRSIPKNNEMGVGGEAHHPRALDEDWTAGIYRGSFVPAQFHWHLNWNGSIHQVGPIEIPGLNVEEMERDEPFDWVGDRRARSAEARRRRMDIIRVKSVRSSASSSVFKFPRTRY